MNLYATPQELAAFLDPDATQPAVPPLATVLIRAASSLVDAQVTEAYRTQNGLPTDPAIRTALREATCEQASAWSLHGIDPRKGAAQAPRRVASKSLNGASTSYVADAAADTALTDLASGQHLTAAAYSVLLNAGLISNRVNVGGRLPETFGIEQRYYDPLTGDLQ